ncbi:hypothetical protein [Roseibacillus persicicus]|uniref:hypothetical protein n=1 Tax=Roseibacillus persicicus TaxID=454148 RepID=UPI0028114438|nr:hypothetical protein [Roseibacillus persicicus]
MTAPRPEVILSGMKSSRLLPLAATLSLASCAQIASTLQEPITSDYNPLDGPNSPRLRSNSFQPTGPTYSAGTWVETATPNATFFNKIPKGNATADKVLSLGTPLKVVATKGSHLKVELEGGSVGYVPTIMVAEPSSSDDTSPFLPPPPSAPLQRSSSSDLAPASLAPAPLQPSGSSLIPPPSSVSASPDPVVIESPERKPTEVLIPTSGSPSPVQLPEAPAVPSSIPAPSGAPDKIDPTIGIE